RQHGENLVLEEQLQRLAPVFRKVRVVRDEQVVLVELWNDIVPETPILQFQHRQQALADGRQLLGWRQPVGGRFDDSRRDLLAQAGYANHEKLIEIIGKNRQELHTFQQRQRVIQRFFQDAVVELQHAQLAIDVQTRIAEIDRLAHRFRKLGQYLVLLNHGSQPVWVQSSMLYGV